MTFSVLIWVSIAVLAYCYVGYPLLVMFRSAMKRRPILLTRSSDEAPIVSIILAVYNEEVVLRRSLDSLLELDYPSSRVEILVGSDGSSDATNAILTEYAEMDSRMRPFLFTSRRGKIPVVNDLVRASTGSILFFTDADVTMDRDVLQHHVAHYAADSIGGVAGNLLLGGEQTARQGPLASERDYMSLENRLRDREARIHSTVGIFGGHYSIRRDAWQELPDEPICDELYIALTVIESGRRMVFDASAIAREYFGRTMSDEFKRKMRFAARGLNTLRLFPRLIGPQGGWTAVMLWSHKVLRWLTPFILLLTLAATILAALAHEAHTTGLLYAELGMALIVAVSALLSRVDRRIPILPHAYWFVSMNVAFALGTVKFVFGREQHFWDQTRRISLLPDEKEALHS